MFVMHQFKALFIYLFITYSLYAFGKS